MGQTTLQEKLTSYIQDAHAMEVNVLQMLGSLIASTDDPAMKKVLQKHKTETERHEKSLRERLEARGSSTATVTKEIPAMLGAMVKGFGDQVRTDKAGKNARDAFVTEHLEIAAYELLERLAERAGDRETAEVARRNKADELAMAEEIASTWDKAIELTLKEAGIAA